jgi:streptomycin 6-kinase
MNCLLNAYIPWIKAWDLTPDGEPFETECTRNLMLPVRQGTRPCMLKIASAPEEIRGAALMTWWNGDGAAEVLAHAGSAILLERASSQDSLAEISRRGDDDRSLSILCRTLAILHNPRNVQPPSNLPRLAEWFQDLTRLASGDTLLARASGVADELLVGPQDEVVLHGDMHHENVLCFGNRGWLAIDPKGLIGERGYDYANIFRNPDQQTALAPGRFDARLRQVSVEAHLDPDRLLRWIIAHAALSSAWSMEDGDCPAWSLKVLEVALNRLDASERRSA